MPKISVVIATYNRGVNLIKTLESLLRQKLPSQLWEVIVVNNNSRDNTEELFERFREAHPDHNMRLVNETRQGLSPARNRGLSEAKGELIVIIDDDELVNEDFLKAYHTFFESHPHVQAAGGRMQPHYDFTPPKWLSPYTEQPIAGTLHLSDYPVRMGRRKFPIGGNMAFRREVVDRLGGFNPELGRTGTKLLAGEEKDFFRRLRESGGEIWYVPKAVVLHLIPENRFDPDYFDRVTRMGGVSERIRTLGKSKGAYMGRLAEEGIKWGGTLILAAGYLLKGSPCKGAWLIRMRRNISAGLLSGK